MGYVRGDDFDGKYFLVKAAREFTWGVIGTLTTSSEGDIAFKFGNEDIDGQRFSVGDIVAVSGIIGEYNGKPQVAGHCEKVQATPEVIRKVVPVSAIDVEAEFSFITETAAHLCDAELCAVTCRLLKRYEDKLKGLPAGIVMHHAFLGGWVEHTGGILRSAIALSEVYGDKLNRDLLISGSILHDIGKVMEFEVNELGMVKDYTFIGDGVGHASIGVGMIMSCAAELGFNPSAPHLAALLNIVGSHAGHREWGACADPVCKEAVVISRLDYVDAHINAMTTSTMDVSYGEKVFSKAGPAYRTT